MIQTHFFRNFFLIVCVLISIPSCDSADDANFVSGVVRNYDALDLSSCGWVIETFNDDGSLEILLPLNLDPFFEQDNLFVLVDFNDTMGITTCSANGVFVQVKDIIINRIE